VAVLVTGATTQLRSEAGVEITCRIIADLLLHAASVRGPRDVLEVTLSAEHLEVTCDEAPLPALEPRHRQGLDECGWTVAAETRGWRLRSTADDRSERRPTPVRDALGER
jgi:hypothetical protein